MIEFKLSNIDIFRRIAIIIHKEYGYIPSKNEVAKELKVELKNICASRGNDSIPFLEILKFSSSLNISADWILLGRGNIFLPNKAICNIKDSQFKNKEDYKPESPLLKLDS